MVKKPVAKKREVRSTVTIAASELWVNLLGFVILQIAIVIGWISATGWHVGNSWKSVLIALAAAALGFGAANLVARRANNSRDLELERDYDTLKKRSQGLVASVDRLEKRSRSSESSASSSGPAL
jgi:hypothetical protein